MHLALYSIPTTNTLNLRVTFIAGRKQHGTLAHGAAETLTVSFTTIGVGNGDNLTMYHFEGDANLEVHPGSVAFVDQSVPGKIAVRYGQPGGKQHNAVFARNVSSSGSSGYA